MKVIEILSNPGLVLSGFEQPGPEYWDSGDLITYQYWYNIGLLQEIYGETVAKFKFISLEWQSLLKSPKIALNRLKSLCFFCQFCLSRLKSP